MKKTTDINGLTNKKGRARDVSAIMRRVRSEGTSPEVKLRDALKAAGVEVGETIGLALQGKPDIVLPNERIAVFVDGDFWHGGQWRRRKFASLEDQFRNSPSRDYWVGKIKKNIDRDFRNTAKLLEQGWTVIRFWESEIIKNIDSCVKTIGCALSSGLSGNIHSALPLRTFIELSAGKKRISLGLSECGWTELDYENIGCVPLVTLLTMSFRWKELKGDIWRGMDVGLSEFGVWTLFDILTRMKDHKPPILLLEMPVGICSTAKKSVLRRILAALVDVEYTVDAFMSGGYSKTGDTKSVFIVAVLESCIPANEIRERSSLYDDPARPRGLSDFIEENPDINWNIRRLPSLSPDKRLWRFKWITQYYLDPLVNELMRGNPLLSYKI